MEAPNSHPPGLGAQSPETIRPLGEWTSGGGLHSPHKRTQVHLDPRILDTQIWPRIVELGLWATCTWPCVPFALWGAMRLDEAQKGPLNI